jgi:SAM-dependent methyltransferase
MTIRKDDLVLEIGPGAYPHWRSDCLIDKFDNESCTDISQFGGLPQKTLGKPLFRMDGTTLPFRDKSFDYVICSHVLEHLNHEELPDFLSEIMRVGRKAYIEFPRTLYDYIYDFDVHLNLMDIVDGEIICLPKRLTRLGDMRRFSRYALELRKTSGFSVELLGPSTIAVGREFNDNIPLRVYEDEEAFFARLSGALSEVSRPGLSWRVANRFKMAIRVFEKKHGSDFFEELLK